MQSQSIKGKKHLVFDDIAEYEDYFRETQGAVPKLCLNWREAEEGEWTVADDGGVVQILKRKWAKRWYYVRTVVGTFFCTSAVTMDTDFSKHPSRYTMAKRDSRVQFDTRENLSVKERSWMALIRSGQSVGEAYREIYGESQNAKEKFHEYLKLERIVKGISAAIKASAEDLGLTPEWVLKQLKDLVEDEMIAPNPKISAIREIAELIGLKGGSSGVKALTSGEEHFSGFRGNELEEPEFEVLPSGEIDDEV